MLKFANIGGAPGTYYFQGVLAAERGLTKIKLLIFSAHFVVLALNLWIKGYRCLKGTILLYPFYIDIVTSS